MPLGVTLVGTAPPSFGGNGWDQYTLQNVGSPATAGIPGGTLPGDLLVCWEIARGGVPGWTSTTGWDDLGVGLAGPAAYGSPSELSVFQRALFRVATGSDPAPTTVSCRSPDSGSGPNYFGHELRTHAFRRTAGEDWTDLADAVVGNTTTILNYTASGYSSTAIAMPSAPSDTTTLLSLSFGTQTLDGMTEVHTEISAVLQARVGLKGHYNPGTLPVGMAPGLDTGTVLGSVVMVIALRLATPAFTHTGVMS